MSSAPLSWRDRDVGVDGEAAFEHGVDVARHHADAVRIVAAQVGLDEVGGHLRGFAVVGAGGGDDGATAAGKRVGAESEGIGHGERRRMRTVLA